ncbi:MAG: tRNA (adenosine(37)-N6)-dimethylallyltransferase MiaA, partial [Candidatus Marinimicrobia bacterium]|nr:tRNA (adenosine(37)-N6)-dimethylallyltransferase MiaA [Candidatus Neomarinimicrobiota bacterium]MBT6938592.1 tRNA (adenosine(37)-N6)-dimethylallyltransferase MiaA [Candidatus Neomarinimicrobiota bacterium]
MEKILTIVGPTASGKTAISVELAKRLDGEVVGLDSRQIYSGIPIGTAQPTIAEKGGIPHHLFGLKPPYETVAAGAYASLVMDVVSEIESRGKTPIICGGAGLYFRALVNGIFVGSKTDQAIRDRLEKEYDDVGSEIMMARLKEADPEYASLVHPNNKKRLVRALEIVETTGKTLSHHFKEQKLTEPPKLDLFTVFLDWDRVLLRDRIAKRTKEMLEAGWIDEVKKILDQYPNEHLHPLDSIGYRQIISHLNGELSEAELEEEIV